MAARAAALACFLATAAAAPQLADKLYACQDQQCVLSARGLPLSECEAGCVPRPNANYTCSGGQCVTSARGLPRAKCTQVCGGPGPAPPPGGKTIVDLAVADRDLSTLVTALKAGGLVGTLSGQGPFTVFAPTNEAFTALPNGVLASLLKPEHKKKLDDVLTYHVVAGTVRAEDLKDGEKLKTLEGKELTVRLSGKDVLINSAKVTTADVNASNGVVHIIDEVLIPAGGPAPPGPPRAGAATRVGGTSVVPLCWKERGDWVPQTVWRNRRSYLHAHVHLRSSQRRRARAVQGSDHRGVGRRIWFTAFGRTLRTTRFHQIEWCAENPMGW